MRTVIRKPPRREQARREDKQAGCDGIIFFARGAAESQDVAGELDDGVLKAGARA
jgi:hypothetical protein